MKRIVCIVVCLALAWGVFGCKPEASEQDKNVTIIVGEVNYQLETSKQYVGQALAELKEREELHLVISEPSEFGRMILEIGELKPTGNAYIAFYSSIDTPDVSFLEYTTTYNDMTLYSCNYGVDSMPLRDGETYLFALETWVAA